MILLRVSVCMLLRHTHSATLGLEGNDSVSTCGVTVGFKMFFFLNVLLFENEKGKPRKLSGWLYR